MAPKPYIERALSFLQFILAQDVQRLVMFRPLARPKIAIASDAQADADPSGGAIVSHPDGHVGVFGWFLSKGVCGLASTRRWTRQCTLKR